MPFDGPGRGACSNEGMCAHGFDPNVSIAEHRPPDHRRHWKDERFAAFMLPRRARRAMTHINSGFARHA